MKIIRIESDVFPYWRKQIEELLNNSALINFPDSNIKESYGHDKCDALASYLSEDMAAVFGAVNGDTLLGWVWCHRIRRISRERLHIAEIAVRDEFRGGGIGGLLLKEAERYALENHLEEVELFVTAENLGAVHFYEKEDFRAERYLMRKRLTVGSDGQGGIQC